MRRIQGSVWNDLPGDGSVGMIGGFGCIMIVGAIVWRVWLTQIPSGTTEESAAFLRTYFNHTAFFAGLCGALLLVIAAIHSQLLRGNVLRMKAERNASARARRFEQGQN